MDEPVPMWPLYRLHAADDHTVTITGPAAPAVVYTDRTAALAAVATLAARLRPPRPVRVEAEDHDGTLWPLLVHPDGTVTEAGPAVRPKTSKAKKRRRKAAEPATPPAEPAAIPLQPALVQDTPGRNGAPVPAPAADPHQAVFAAAAAGRHGEAAAMAAAWEQEALRAQGPASPATIHWIEVQAELAHQADDPGRASGLWLRSAFTRLSAGQDPAHPDVEAAVDRAHHCWHAVTDPRVIQELGIELLSLRARVPGKTGAQADVQRRLARHASR